MFESESFQFASRTGEEIIKARLYRPYAVDSPVSTDKPGITEKPAAQTGQLVQIVHGMAEHSQRYDDFCQFLASRGIAVCIHDQAGHGLTAPDPGRLGFFGYPDGWLKVLDDISQTRKIAMDKLCLHKELPDRWQSVLFGHSMGSFISRLYCARQGDHLTAAVFSGTAGANPAVHVGYALARWSVKRHGPLYKDKFLAKLTGAGFLKRINNPRTPVDWLTRDQSIVDAYQADPLCGFVFTAAGYADLYRWIREVSGHGWHKRVPADLPILLLSGSDDPVGNYGKGPQQVYRWLKSSGHQVKLKLYPSGRHEMINEVNRLNVWQDIVDWLDDLPAGKTTFVRIADQGGSHDYH